MACTVVKHQSVDESGLVATLVLHIHDLDHVQVDRLALLSDTLHRAHYIVCHFVSCVMFNFVRRHTWPLTGATLYQP